MHCTIAYYYNNFNCNTIQSNAYMQGNNFQVVVATDGNQSFAVFTYQCGGLNWVQGVGATIGFSASKYFFANNPFSRQPNINSIACFNQTCPPWTNVVYKINSEPDGW